MSRFAKYSEEGTSKAKTMSKSIIQLCLSGRQHLTSTSAICPAIHLFCYGCLKVVICMYKYIRKIITVLGHHLKSIYIGWSDKKTKHIMVNLM